MHTCYRDILSRIPEEPKWFDENAVPRYCDFSPRETANIYAKQCILLRIECQGCRRSFNVAMTSYGLDKRQLFDKIENVHYGDPPNIECCDAGPTMNSSPQQVLEAWSLDDKYEWARRPEFEVKIDRGY